MTLRVEPRGKKLWVRGVFLGQEVRRTTGFHVGQDKQAEEVRLQIEQEILNGTYRLPSGERTDAAKTFEDAAKSYENTKNPSDDTVSKLRIIRDKWDDWELEEIGSDDIAEWVYDDFEDRAPSTIDRYMTQFKAVLNHAHEMGWLPVVPKCLTIRYNDRRDEHFTLEEIDQFLEWLGTHYPFAIPILLCLMDAGLRLGEATRLKWRDVNFSNEEITVKAVRKSSGKGTKTQTRVVPMSERLKNELAILKTKSAHPTYVFTGINGIAFEEYGNKKSASSILGRILKEFCEDAGINPPLRVHDLRHTFAYQATQYGADLGDLQQLMGHSNISMTMRYRGWIKSRAKNVVAGFGSS